MAKKVLITGTSSGFGKLIAQTLLKNAHTVVASMRDPEGRNAEAAEELRTAGAKIVEIDVTDDASVDQGVAQAIEVAGGLDVVVNNAGIGVLGLQEAFSPADWKRLFDINVIGVQRMNRAALPTLRAQNSGLLIQISSALGRFVLPFMGPYNASKWAVEALADNYRVELSGFGVDSVIVEPGAYPTDFSARLLQPSDSDRLESLGEYANAAGQMMEGFAEQFAGDNAPKPQAVADAVAKLIDTPAGERPFRTVVDQLGMGEAIEPYNQQAEAVTAGIYEAFGMSDMLELK
jgi:NAD(P)-dependent dehydrogenase (short-subunit alcohol dehydrogenase family)